MFLALRQEGYSLIVAFLLSEAGDDDRELMPKQKSYKIILSNQKHYRVNPQSDILPHE